MGQQLLARKMTDTNGHSKQQNSRFTREGLLLPVIGSARLERNYGHAQRGAQDSARGTIRYFENGLNGLANRAGLLQESFVMGDKSCRKRYGRSWLNT